MQKKWWHGKVAYQIYPKSFKDSNGDGIGDLRGIIGKLDYLQELGIEILWLSPCYKSPLADQGYDISDYYDIDPRFGSMSDMDELIAEAKKRGIGIVMDLVVNHCSDEHEWFQKACQDPNGPYGRYFYIEDKKDGKVPCNWRSYFGGSVWTDLPGHPDKCYLHMFHKKQPDLNWENPEVREEIYKMVNWWLDKGLAGFRIDAIINIKKVLPWKDYPADRPDGLCRPMAMLEEAKGIGEFLGEMRDRCFLPHDAFTAGEVFNEKDEEFPDFIGDKGYFSTIFDFNATYVGASEKGWYDFTPITIDQYKDCFIYSQKRAGDIGFYANIIENHDEPRGVSRYLPADGRTETGKKMLATVMMMLKGIPFIYQGQEIGMENVSFSTIDEVDDVSTLDEYQVALDAGLSPKEALRGVSAMSRDNARTPFQWDDSNQAGFTSGKPWLRVNPNYTKINLADQRGREDSVYEHYRSLIALRKNPEYADTIVYGEFSPLWETEENLIAFYRRDDKKTIFVVANASNQERQIDLEQPYKKVLLNTNEMINSKNQRTIVLAAYQGIIFEF